MQAILDRVIKGLLYSLVFLVPLFFLPFSFEAFEFNKQYLLVFLVFTAFLVWGAKIVIRERKISFRYSWLDAFIIAFLLVAVLSAVFSVDRFSSVFGFYGRFSDGLLLLLTLVLLYFLITNHGKLIPLLSVFCGSSFLVVLATYLSILGFWQKVKILPAVLKQKTFNPTASTLEGLAVFLSVVVVLLVAVLLTSKPRKQSSAFFYILVLIADCFLLFLIDFTPAWVVLLVSMVVLTAILLTQAPLESSEWLLTIKGQSQKAASPRCKTSFCNGASPSVQAKRMSMPGTLTGQGLERRDFWRGLKIPFVLIVIAIIGLSLDMVVPFLESLPKEVLLDRNISWQIAFSALKDNFKQGVLGSGIGTFFYDFTKYKPSQFNETEYWRMRFDRPANSLAEITATMGIFGILAYLALIGMFLLIAGLLMVKVLAPHHFSRPKSGGGQLPVLLATIALFLSQVVYYQNTTLAFSFWLFLGLSVLSLKGKGLREFSYDFKSSAIASFVSAPLFVVGTAAILGFFFLFGKFYLADVKYADFSRKTMRTETTRLELLKKAVALNPHEPQYKIVLARTLANSFLDEMRKPVDHRATAILSNYLTEALGFLKGESRSDRQGVIVKKMKGAVELSPNFVSGWETLAMIYRDIRGGVPGALEWSIKAFEKASILEPTNPLFHTDLAELYLEADEIEKARKEVEKARFLKPDYLDGLIQELFVLEKEGKIEEAVRRAESLLLDYPFSSDVLFQAGRLYFNNSQIEQAIRQFEKLLVLSPNHSNALYSLAVAYKLKGDNPKALEYFKRVLTLNPGNEDVQAKIKELEKIK